MLRMRGEVRGAGGGAMAGGAVPGPSGAVRREGAVAVVAMAVVALAVVAMALVA